MKTIEALIKLCSEIAGIIRTIAAIVIVWQLQAFGTTVITNMSQLSDNVGGAVSSLKHATEALTSQKFQENQEKVRAVGDGVVDSFADWKARAADKLKSKNENELAQ